VTPQGCTWGWRERGSAPFQDPKSGHRSRGSGSISVGCFHLNLGSRLFLPSSSCLHSPCITPSMNTLVPLSPAVGSSPFMDLVAVGTASLLMWAPCDSHLFWCLFYLFHMSRYLCHSENRLRNHFRFWLLGHTLLSRTVYNTIHASPWGLLHAFYKTIHTFPRGHTPLSNTFYNTRY